MDIRKKAENIKDYIIEMRRYFHQNPELSLEELETKVNELKQELFNLKFQKTLGQLQNTAKIKDVKRTIARLKTVVTEKTVK